MHKTHKSMITKRDIVGSYRQFVSPSVRQSFSPSVHRNLKSFSEPSPGSGLVLHNIKKEVGSLVYSPPPTHSTRLHRQPVNKEMRNIILKQTNKSHSKRNMDDRRPMEACAGYFME